MGRFKSLRFDFYVFNFDTMKVILFGKSAEKPYGKLLLTKRNGTQVSYQYLRSNMVEVGGVEPPSESTLTGFSPGAGGYCGSLPPCSPSRRQTVTPSGQVRVMMRGRVNSFPPHGRHINDAFPGLWPLRFRRLP